VDPDKIMRDEISNNFRQDRTNSPTLTKFEGGTTENFSQGWTQIIFKI